MLKYAHTEIRMANSSEWTIVFYLVDNGANPVDDFLSGLDARAKAKSDWAIAQLRAVGSKLRYKQLKG